MSSKKEEREIKKGLEGVIADYSEVSFVDVEKKMLFYRGYRVDELVEHAHFEEVAYLLIFGKYPSNKQLKEFCEAEREERFLPDYVKEMLISLPSNTHPMDALIAAVGLLGCTRHTHDFSDSLCYRQFAIQLLAKVPLIIADFLRIRNKQSMVRARKDISVSEHFFYACFGSVPEDVIVRAFDQSLILYAEHCFNTSTFTARMITSSESSFFGAIVGAIACLKGSLHGGAIEAVLNQFLEIEHLDDVPQWLDEKLEKKERIMGFGHRLYRLGDARVPSMQKALLDLAKHKKDLYLADLYFALEAEMIQKKGIYPNLDYTAGPAYHLMGFDADLFAPIFVMSRLTGWSAHIIEQSQSNRLIHPDLSYTGPKYKPL